MSYNPMNNIPYNQNPYQQQQSQQQQQQQHLNRFQQSIPQNLQHHQQQQFNQPYQNINQQKIPTSINQRNIPGANLQQQQQLPHHLQQQIPHHQQQQQHLQQHPQVQQQHPQAAAAAAAQFKQSNQLHGVPQQVGGINKNQPTPSGGIIPSHIPGGPGVPGGQPQQQQQQQNGTPNQFLLAAQTITKVQENTHYWSELLKKEGKPLTKDVLFYEQLINRDVIFKHLHHQLESSSSNKKILNRLLSNLKYYNDLKISRMKTISLSNQGTYSNTIWGEGFQGYGNGFSDGATRIVLPKDRKKPSRLRDTHHIPRKVNQQQQPQVPQGPIDELIPIRLEFENEKDRFKLRDTFLWNLNEKSMTLENLVSIIMEDYKFTNPLLSDTILASIKEQVSEFHSHRYQQNSYGFDLRIIIKLDIIISNNQLIDQFEWDISNPLNSPEEFASEMAMDLSLPGEFATAIAHSIREQSQLYTKALYLIGYDFNGGFIDEDEIRSNLQKIITFKDYLRPKNLLNLFTPQILEISNPELERLDKDRERDSRRKRRQGRTGRRGGPVLPDLKDVPRTFRTPIYSTILPGGIDVSDSVGSYNISTEIINKPIENPPQNQTQTNTTNSAISTPQQLINNKQTPILSSTNELSTPGGKKRKVVYNHHPGESCVVSIKLRN